MREKKPYSLVLSFSSHSVLSSSSSRFDSSNVLLLLLLCYATSLLHHHYDDCTLVSHTVTQTKIYLPLLSFYSSVPEYKHSFLFSILKARMQRITLTLLFMKYVLTLTNLLLQVTLDQPQAFSFNSIDLIEFLAYIPFCNVRMNTALISQISFIIQISVAP